MLLYSSFRLLILLVSSVVLLGCTSDPFRADVGLVWLTGSTATVVDLNMGPEPGALWGNGEERMKRDPYTSRRLFSE